MKIVKIEERNKLLMFKGPPRLKNVPVVHEQTYNNTERECENIRHPSVFPSD